MGIVKSLFRRGGETDADMGEAPRAAQSTPQLFMLTPDAAGIAAYQISTYGTAREAEAYLDEHLRGEVREGTIVFWGLTWLPAPGDDHDLIEPVVLIRDVRRAGQVYTFSFADVGSAFDFVRHEMKAGLDISQVSVYWALQARITVDFWGRATIIPPNPPLRSRMHIVARREGTAAVAPVEVAPQVIEEEAAVIEDTKPAVKDAESALPEKLEALDEDDLDKVVRILDARGIRPSTNGHHAPEEIVEDEAPEAAEAIEAEAEDEVHAAEIETPEEAPAIHTEESEEPDEALPVADDTIHVQLSDVYGGPMKIVRKTDRDALNGLGDYGREHEEPAAFLPEGAAAVEEIAAPSSIVENEPESGIVVAWANICFALDQAIDVHVAQKVSATIVWRRLSTALAEAAEAQHIQTARKAWANGADALAFAASYQDAQDRAMITAWHNGARALRRAAEVQSGQRAMRHAWLNISWTLDEAALAYNLERKARVLTAWSIMGPALAQAAERKHAMERGMRTAWTNAAVGAVAAAEAQVAHHNGLATAWSAAGNALYEAGAAMFQQRRIEFAWRAAGRAVLAATETKLRHDGMITAWEILTNETMAAAEAQEAHRLGLVLAWHAIGDATADGVAAMYRHRRVTVAMRNSGLALHEAVAAKVYRDSMITSWKRISQAAFDAVVEMARMAGLKKAWKIMALELLTAADMQVSSEAAKAAWSNASAVLFEAACAKIHYEGLVDAWQSTGRALGEYAAAKVYHDALVEAWDAIGLAVSEGAVAKVKHDAIVRAWRNAARAFRNAAQAYYVRQMSYRQSWERLTDAITLAVETKVLRDGEKAAWSAISIAMADAVEARLYHEMVVEAWTAFTDAVRDAMPVYLRDLGLKSAWGHASRALREATVAEAQLRIAEASGEGDLLKEVKEAIRKAKSATASAKPEVEVIEEIVAEEPVAEEVAVEEPVAEEIAASVEEIQKLKPARRKSRRPSAKAKRAKKEEEAVEELEVTAGVEESTEEKIRTKFGEEADVKDDDSDEVVGEKAAIELWRFRENGRFESRDEVFHGFESPPGRF